MTGDILEQSVPRCARRAGACELEPRTLRWTLVVCAEWSSFPFCPVFQRTEPMKKPCRTRPPGSPYSDDADGHLWADNGGACRR